VHPNAQANALLGAYMYAQLTGTPWIETLPLTGAEVDYRMTASIATPGEVDKVVVALVAGTTYTLEMLGMSALGTAGSLADPSLRLLGPNGSVAGFNADSGVGFDATLTFTAATTGTYTLELSSTGVPTGVYALQAAAVGGAATLAGNTYTVTNAATVILEGAGGVGQDVVKAGVSYVLNAGAEIEVLRTTNDRGKTAIDLTGNDFSQTIVGNAAGNRIEGKGGADVLTGGGGNDVFVLGNYALTNAAQIDSISDYAKGDVVDITQVLSVGAGTNVVAGGYLRVTTSGLVQVDLNGGGSEWVTLSTINGNGAVAVRYVSGGTVTNVSVSRVAANTNIALAGVVAAAGLTAVPAAAESFDQQGFVGVANFSAADSGIGPLPSATLLMRSALADEIGESLDGGAAAQSLNLARDAAWNGADSNAFAASNTASSIALTPLLQGTVAPAQSHGDAHALVAQAVAMPSAEMIMPALEGVAASALDAAAGPKATGEVARVIAEALSGGGNDAVIDALLDALPGQGHGAEALASLAAGHGFADAGHFGMHALAKAAFAVEALAVHADLPLQA
jgi:hypothetical protein